MILAHHLPYSSAFLYPRGINSHLWIDSTGLINWRGSSVEMLPAFSPIVLGLVLLQGRGGGGKITFKDITCSAIRYNKNYETTFKPNSNRKTKDRVTKIYCKLMYFFRCTLTKERNEKNTQKGVKKLIKKYPEIKLKSRLKEEKVN